MGGGGAGKWVKYAPKPSHTPPSQKAKINFNPHSHNDNIKANHLPPPPPVVKSLLPLIPHTWFTCWISSSSTNITSNDSSTHVEKSFEESSESLDSELVSSLHEFIGRLLIFFSISGTKVPACVGENSGIPV